MLAIAFVASYNIYTSLLKTELTDMMVANIEALAEDENSGYSCSASANCYFGNRVEGSVSCSGKKSCTSGYEYVICDGYTSYCL